MNNADEEVQVSQTEKKWVLLTHYFIITFSGLLLILLGDGFIRGEFLKLRYDCHDLKLRLSITALVVIILQMISSYLKIKFWSFQTSNRKQIKRFKKFVDFVKNIGYGFYVSNFFLNLSKIYGECQAGNSVDVFIWIFFVFSYLVICGFFLFLCIVTILLIYFLTGGNLDNLISRENSESGLPYLTNTTLRNFQEFIGILPDVDITCPICLSDFEDDDQIRSMPCNHHFHQACIDQWLVENDTCPYCRLSLGDIERSENLIESGENTNSQQHAVETIV